MLKQAQFLALGEAKVGNAKESTESPLPGISTAVDSAVTAPFPCAKAQHAEGCSKLSC